VAADGYCCTSDATCNSLLHGRSDTATTQRQLYRPVQDLRPAGIGFDVTPEKIKLQSVLSFLSDLLSELSPGGGFSCAFTPAGLRATLSLPLPDISSGAFGISNLSLGFFFELDLLSGFSISTGVNVASRMAPFGLTIFILGGAGFLESSVKYTPSSGALEATVSIGLFAEASFAISLGPISGGIYAYLGITVDYFASNKKPSRLTIGLLILFRGEVSLLGFISVALCLSLEAQYQTGGKLIGRGRVSYDIKIGWFIDIHVSAEVTYTFGGSGRSARGLPATATKTAGQRYIAMFA